MEKFIIKGGRRLVGSVKIEGAKNAVLPMQAASLLASSGKVLLLNVPLLSDTATMTQLLRSLNIDVKLDETSHRLMIDASRPVSSEAPLKYVSQMRASMVVLGPLLARTGHVKIGLPGGCSIGKRPIDLHLNGLRQLGATIDEHDDYIEAHAKRLVGANIHLNFPSVGATQNILMAATLAQGITTIQNAAREPEITDLAAMLNKMGAKVHGAGTDTIRIQGVDFLHGCEHTVMPDRIEAGTYMIAAAVTNGDVVVQGALPEHNVELITKLEEMGVTVICQDDGIRILGTAVLIPANVTTEPYPGFPTDLQPQISVLQLLANGTSLLDETVFEKRYIHLQELKKMNASVQFNDHNVALTGPTHFKGAEVAASDLRAGAALVIAGLAAEGITVVDNLNYIDRGYYHLHQKLQQLGAQIDRVDITEEISTQTND